MREKINLKKYKKEKKKDIDKRPLQYDATFDEILYMVVGNDKRSDRKNYRLPVAK